MAAVTRVTILFGDAHGQSVAFVFHVPATVVDPTDPIITGLITRLNAMLDTVCIKVEISAARSFAGSPGTQAYSTVSDKAVITAIDANGQAHTAKIPGPKEEIFDTDKETIDMSNALVVAYGSAVEDFTGRGGDVLIGITEGHRGTARRMSKF